MSSAAVVLLALLTRALNPCCRSLNLGDADRQNEQSEHLENSTFKVSRALTFSTKHVPITCECWLKKWQSTRALIFSVEKLKVVIEQVFISKSPKSCFCEVLNRQILGGQNKLECNKSILGFQNAFNQSNSCLSYCHVYLLLMKFMNSCFCLKMGRISENVWTNALYMVCELNVKNQTREMDFVCFKVHTFMAPGDQMAMTDKVCLRIGAWFLSTNISESNKSNAPRLTMYFSGVKLLRPAVNGLVGSIPKQTDDWTMPSLICVCTTVHCKLLLSLHRSLYMMSHMRGNGDSCTYDCAEVYQFIWTCLVERYGEKELQQINKSCSRSNMRTCADEWKPEEISPPQWQICTQLLSRGLFHQWILRVLITVSLFLISQPVYLTYMLSAQTCSLTHRVSNSHRSFLLLFTISWCSLSPLSVIWQSAVFSRKLHHTAFGITFVLCISCVLGKTIVVLIVLKTTIPGSNVKKWLGRLPQRHALAFTMRPIFVIVFRFSIHSSSFILSMNCYQEQMTLKCEVFSVIGVCTNFYQLGLSFILTFLVCSLPFTLDCYSVLNIHAMMGGTTKIYLRALLG